MILVCLWTSHVPYVWYLYLKSQLKLHFNYVGLNVHVLGWRFAHVNWQKVDLEEQLWSSIAETGNDKTPVGVKVYSKWELAITTRYNYTRKRLHISHLRLSCCPYFPPTAPAPAVAAYQTTFTWIVYFPGSLTIFSGQICYFSLTSI